MEHRQIFNEISYDVIQVDDKPSEKFNFIGITGNGDRKPVTRLIRAILQYLGRSSKIVDTARNISIKEYSYSSLTYHRANLYDFDIRIFTDLNKDLSNVKNENSYKNSMMKLFKVCGLGLINVDDPLLNKISKNVPFDAITYGINATADFMAKDIRYSQCGINFILDFNGSEKKVKINSFNKSNVYDTLAAIGTCYFLGFPLNLIINALTQTEIF